MKVQSMISFSTVCRYIFLNAFCNLFDGITQPTPIIYSAIILEQKFIVETINAKEKPIIATMKYKKKINFYLMLMGAFTMFNIFSMLSKAYAEIVYLFKHKI